MTARLTGEQIAAEAEILDQAERPRTQARQTTSIHPEISMGDAYRVQAAMKISTPDSGFLTADMVFTADSTLVIADNAADAGIICGARTASPREIDLRWISALGYRNGVIEETGGAGVLDSFTVGFD